MSLAVEARIGKKYAVYLPKSIAKAVGVKEGDKVLLRVEGEAIILEVIRDPIELALTGRKFASVKPEEVEAVSVEGQERFTSTP
ncbi:MAG: AbrB/MazE/SpoVT family DNA-binding domain-containing protein [Thermofilum sp.]